MFQSSSFLSGLLNTSTDVIILSLLVVGFFFFTLYFGKRKMLSFILSLFPAYVVFTLLPKDKFLILDDSAFQIELNLLLLFIIIVMISQTALGRAVDSNFSYTQRRKPMRAFILSFVAVSLLLFTIHQTSGLDEIYRFGSWAGDLFNNSLYFLLWIVVSLLSVFWYGK